MYVNCICHTTGMPVEWGLKVPSRRPIRELPPPALPRTHCHFCSPLKAPRPLHSVQVMETPICPPRSDYRSSVYMYVCTSLPHVEVRGQFSGVGCLLPQCGMQELNPGCQAWWQASFPRRPLFPSTTPCPQTFQLSISPKAFFLLVSSYKDSIIGLT